MFLDNNRYILHKMYSAVNSFNPTKNISIGELKSNLFTAKFSFYKILTQF